MKSLNATIFAILAIFTVSITITALAGAEQPNVKIVALGASNTEGYGVAPEESYPSQLQALLKAKGIDASIANAGISGDPTGSMLARLDKAVPAGTQIVILQPGTNDDRYGLGAEREGNIAKIKRSLSARGIKLIVIENGKLDELPRSELQPDGVHFTAKGYKILAERLLPEVIAAMGE